MLTVKELRAFVMIGAEPMFVRPPLKVIVDAFRVEGIPPPLGGGYTALFIELIKRLAELMVLVLIAFATMEPVLMVLVLRAGVFRLPFRVARPDTSKELPSCVGS